LLQDSYFDWKALSIFATLMFELEISDFLANRHILIKRGFASFNHFQAKSTLTQSTFHRKIVFNENSFYIFTASFKPGCFFVRKLFS